MICCRAWVTLLAEEFGVAGVALDDDAESDDRVDLVVWLEASSCTTSGSSNAPGTWWKMSRALGTRRISSLAA